MRQNLLTVKAKALTVKPPLLPARAPLADRAGSRLRGEGRWRFANALDRGDDPDLAKIDFDSTVETVAEDYAHWRSEITAQLRRLGLSVPLWVKDFKQQRPAGWHLSGGRRGADHQAPRGRSPRIPFAFRALEWLLGASETRSERRLGQTTRIRTPVSRSSAATIWVKVTRKDFVAAYTARLSAASASPG